MRTGIETLLTSTERFGLKFDRTIRRERQRRDLDAVTKSSRALREPRVFVDMDGNERVVGWHPPKRERPRCGARTRGGGSCKAPVVRGKARCRMHGGLSTGPKTAEGKARAAAAAKARWERWRAERAAAAKQPA